MTPLRWAALALIGLAMLFAVQGGEYSTTDWLELRRREREERAQVARLERAVDSLQVMLKRVREDPREQERIARETFGMIRRGEFLYRLVPPEEP